MFTLWFWQIMCHVFQYIFTSWWSLLEWMSPKLWNRQTKSSNLYIKSKCGLLCAVSSNVKVKNFHFAINNYSNSSSFFNANLLSRYKNLNFLFFHFDSWNNISHNIYILLYNLRRIEYFVFNLIAFLFDDCYGYIGIVEFHCADFSSNYHI